MAANGGVRRAVGLSRGQALHERLTRAVLKLGRGTEPVLKGGGAVAFCYGAGLHSTDLDFDVRRRVDLRWIIRRPGRVAGVEMNSVEHKPGRRSASAGPK